MAAPYQIDFYTNNRGQHPIEDYLTALDDKEIDAVMWTISLLAAAGPILTEPHCKKLQGHHNLWELRIRHWRRHFRIVYTRVDERRYVLLHIFQKDRNTLRREDLDIATRRLDTLIQ